MSTYNYLICHQCRKSLWLSKSMAVLQIPEAALMKFLQDHSRGSSTPATGAEHDMEVVTEHYFINSEIDFEDVDSRGGL